jgi:hypothetical protein
VGYGEEGYRMESRVFYSLPEYYVFVAPTDVNIEAEGWEHLGPEPEAASSPSVDGASLRRHLSDEALRRKRELGHVLERGRRGRAAPRDKRPGRIIPDRTHYSKAVVVMFMAAASHSVFSRRSTLLPPAELSLNPALRPSRHGA